MTFSSSSELPEMAIDEAFSLARLAKLKLTKEASGNDPCLRQLLSHANLFDSLMLKLCMQSDPHTPGARSPAGHNNGMESTYLKRSKVEMAIAYAEDMQEHVKDKNSNGWSGPSSDSESDESPSDTDTESDSDSDSGIVSDDEEYDGLIDAILQHNITIDHDTQKPLQIFKD